MALRCLAYFLSLLSLQLFASSANSAITYEQISLNQGGRLLLLKGEFEASDDPMKLVAEYTQFQPAFITFDSNGGSVVAAMKFGRAIRALAANTLQIRSTQCASACALAFVGGAKRSAEPGSIGVHQAFFSDDADVDNKTAVSVVQAMTGEIIGYLSDMGVSPKLLQLSLSIDSSDMRYLTKAEMQEWDITTSEDLPAVHSSADQAKQPTDSTAPGTPARSASASVAAPDSEEDEAINFIRRYHVAWSRDGPTALGFMRNAYADPVTFYGKLVDREAVLKDKATFAQRWPDRAYSIKPGSETAQCSDKCDISGIVEWFARSRQRGKTSSGIAQFSVVWNPASGQIEAETGKVIAMDKGATAPDRIISQWHVENGECRGSTSPESAETKNACARREEIGAALDRVGWCYGHKNEYGYQMKWHVCDTNSYRQHE